MFFFFVPEIFKFSYYANLAIDDVIGCASTVVGHKIENISANNAAMLLKLGRDVAPYIPDGTNLDVTMATCSVNSPFLFKIKNYHLQRGKIYRRVKEERWGGMHLR